MTKVQAIRSPKARLNFPQLFSPKASKPGQTPKYSAMLIFDEKAQQTKEFKELKAAIDTLVNEKYPKDKFPKGAPASFKHPFKKGEEITTEAGDRYAGCDDGTICIRAQTTFAPEILDQAKNRVTEEAIVYSGCYVMAKLTPALFEVDGAKGITVYLGNLMKVGEGERLGGKRSATSDFEDVESIEIEETVDDF